MAVNRLLSCVLLVAVVALVFWLRTAPLSLAAVNDMAAHFVTMEISERIARETEPDPSPEKYRTAILRNVEEWFESNEEEFRTKVGERADSLKSQFRVTWGDGRKQAYLGDTDSYHWLRAARNYIRRGTTCDDVVDDECRDTYGNAPVGHRMLYNRSVHIAAIVGVDRLVDHFDPEFPLVAAAFWVPVIVAVLGVIPAFFVGRRFAGNLGGLFAAVVTSIHPVLLMRSIGSDNDIWHGVLPLFAFWAAVEALRAKRFHLLGLAALAGGVAGVHAATWRGGLFFFVVFLSGLLAAAALSFFRAMLRKHDGVPWWRNPEAGRALLVAGAYVLATVAVAGAAGTEESRSFFAAPLEFLQTDGDVPEAAVGDAQWPSVFSTVWELKKPELSDLAPFMGAEIYLALAVAGIVSALMISLRAPGESRPTLGGTLILVAWFVGAFDLALRGQRFSLLFVVPFGIGLACLVGWLYDTVCRRLPEPPSALGKRLLESGVGAVLLLLLIPPVMAGHATARNYLPQIDNAWWETLVKIREESSPDAIVNSWWDYGYWIKYLAERRVSVDGGTLRTHAHHWIAKALLARDETEAVGILRMLNCGSDATPFPEGELGAYGKLIAAGQSGVDAYTALSTIVVMDAAEARAHLAAIGLTEDQLRGVLGSSHCDPPESFVVLDQSLEQKSGALMRIGLWDVATGVAPAFPIRPTVWMQCFVVSPGSLIECPLGPMRYGPHLGQTAFSYDPTSPETGRIVLRAPPEETAAPPPEEAAAAPVAGQTTLLEHTLPAAVLVAGEDGLSRGTAPDVPQIEVLLDAANGRVLVGPPHFVGSTFSQLFFLEGRYSKHFEAFDRRATFMGNVVTAWKIRWKLAEREGFEPSMGD